jgi:hypothetical protein
MAEEARLDVIERERAIEERIVFEIDLANGEVISRAPVGMHLANIVGTQRGHGSASVVRVKYVVVMQGSG